MIQAHARELSRRFHEWEERGRGKRLFPSPVSLEPPYEPFFHHVQAPQELDDVRRHTLRSFLADLFLGRRLPEQASRVVREPKPWKEIPVTALRLSLPADLRTSREASEGFLRALLVLEHPLSWEVEGRAGAIRYFVALPESDRPALDAALSAFLPGVLLSPSPAMSRKGSGSAAVYEFALAQEFVVPLKARSQSDPLLPLLALLSQTSEEESVSLQVLFVPARHPWKESILRAVRTPSGLPFFADAPEVTRLAEEKVASPLFAASIRVRIEAPSPGRLSELSRLVAGAIATLAEENSLYPLGDNPKAGEDFERRVSRRSGVILSLSELALLVHLPAPDLPVPGIERGSAKEKAPPEEALSGGLFLGEVASRGTCTRVFLPEAARERHTYVVGATGTGKTTLLLNLILNDIEAGRGVGVVDPHGDLVEEILARLPEGRSSETVVLDPSDPELSRGWNALQVRGEAEREVLSSDLVALFRRYATSWGDQMTAVLSNSVAALLSLPGTYTLSDLRRFLVDRAWRASLLSGLDDPELRFFWEKEFAHIGERSLGPILGRLNTFLRSRAIRESISERDGTDFRSLLDRGGIFLARLPLGSLGEENVAVLGSLLVSRLHQVALSRVDRRPEERTPFSLYLDEFHLFVSPSLSLLLSGARKFGLSLTMAHQSLSSLHARFPEIEASLLANAYTRIIFRVGEEDARKLGQSLSAFDSRDLLGLKTGEAICRLGTKENDFLVAIPPPVSLPGEEAEERRSRLKALLRERTPKREEPPVVVPAQYVPVPEAPVCAPVKRELQGEPRSPKPKKSQREASLPGKGGAEHTYLQELVKRWAEEQGFRAAVEEQIPGTRESVDVALYRGTVRIACEISVTTTPEHEAGNAEKCLSAGFAAVALISPKRSRLKGLEQTLRETLPPERFERVHLFTPEGFLAWLSELPVEEAEGVVGGYKVKVRYQIPRDARSTCIAEILARGISGLEKSG